MSETPDLKTIEQTIKRMTPEQRLAAFLAHCQLMVQLAEAGGAGRALPRGAVSPNAR